VEIGAKVNLNEMYIGTLHSIFLRILEENGEFTWLKRSYRVMDTFDQKYFVYRFISEFLEVGDAEILLWSYPGGKWQKAQKVIDFFRENNH
jgi:DNA helicase II / ATP-dependent DNA helicase PcrA